MEVILTTYKSWDDPPSRWEGFHSFFFGSNGYWGQIGLTYIAVFFESIVINNLQNFGGDL